MLKTTLIGHACLCIQSRDTTILTDPVWFDYLWEEINVLCPSIDLNKKNIPPVDILNISHRHQDHFDVRTLAYLAQDNGILKPDATILAPEDHLILDVLKELEFKNIKVVKDFEPIIIKDVTLTPTPSRNRLGTAQDDFPEHGLLVSDGEVTVWNQVDTIVNPEIISQILQIAGKIDLAHARFVPLLEGNFSYNKSFALPFDEYCTFLNVVKAVGPRMVVPGSAAFRFRDEFNFLNRYSFPTTQEQFLKDLSAFCPEVPSSPYLPGDVAHVSAEEVKIEQQASNFVCVKEEDSHRVIFKPVMEVSPVKTRTIDQEQHKKEMSEIREFIESELLDRLLKSDMAGGWKDWQMVYQLEVFGQDDSECWSIDFGESEPKIHKGTLGKINLYEGIAASELFSLIQKTTSWDFVALCGNYRTFNNIYRVTNGNFEFCAAEKTHDYAFEPLMVAFPWDLEMDREKFMQDVRKWKGVPQQ